MRNKLLLTILPLSLFSAQNCKGDAFSDLSASCMRKILPCIWLYRRANFQPGDQAPFSKGDDLDCQTNSDHDKLCQYNLNSGSLIGCGGSFMGVTFVNGEANVIFEPSEGAGDFRYTWRKGGNLKSNGIDILDVYCTLAKK